MSTTKKIEYDTDDQDKFAHDADEISIDSSGATFKKLALLTDELFAATARIEADADRAKDDNTSIFFVGTAAWDEANSRYDLSDPAIGNYMSLNDDSGRDGITPLSPNSHFNFTTEGCIRRKITPTYDGSPSVINYFFTTGESITAGGLGSLLSLNHDTGGNITVITRDNVGVGTVSANLGAWVAVNGQEYEFELNYDVAGNKAELFIDGISLGTGSVSANPNGRDFFYDGTYYIANFKSVFFARDLQIFNKVQHTSNFASEVPRVVNVYPLESLITPAEFSTAEGFFSASEESELNGTATVPYVMKIANALKFISGAAIVDSDGTQAESNTLTEWNADEALVTAFISSGARITMVPILSSGPLGIFNLLLKTTTLIYNFFAVPAGCDQCTLHGFVNDNCDDIASGTVRVFTTKPIHTQGLTVAFDKTVDIRTPNGLFELDLVIPNLPLVAGRDDDTYKIQLRWTDTDGKLWKEDKNIIIPNEETVVYDENIIQ